MERSTPCVTLGARVLDAARAALVRQSSASMVHEALRARPSAPRALLAVGKAAAAMAEGAIAALGAIPGLVVCKEAPPAALGMCDVVTAGHPRPDAGSARAARLALELAAGVGPDDELLALVSGGASSLIGAPIAGVTIEAFAALTDRLLRGGVPIADLNRVRRRLGVALGGRLAAATRARVRLLVVSDVESDDLRVIGSGPFSAPPSDDPDAAAEIARAAGVEEGLVRAILAASPDPDELAAALAGRIDAAILARPRDLARAAQVALAARGLDARVEPRVVDGPVEALATRLLARARRLAPGEAEVLVGEPTVEVTGPGLGGRAQHCALLVALGLAYPAPDRDLVCLALGSDGSDGPTDAAGALVSAETAARARTAGIDLRAAAEHFDSHPALDALGALVRTGATGTNLTDLYVIARAPARDYALGPEEGP